MRWKIYYYYSQGTKGEEEEGSYLWWVNWISGLSLWDPWPDGTIYDPHNLIRIHFNIVIAFNLITTINFHLQPTMIDFWIMVCLILLVQYCNQLVQYIISYSLPTWTHCVIKLSPLVQPHLCHAGCVMQDDFGNATREGVRTFISEHMAYVRARNDL